MHTVEVTVEVKLETVKYSLRWNKDFVQNIYL